MEALELFKESLKRLKNKYNSFCFFKERDIVWELQKYLLKLVKEKQLPYKIFSDYPMVRHGKFSILCDLVIIRGDKVEIAIEFKYEPDHNRKNKDILESKFKPSVVFWGEEGVTKDIRRIKEFVEKGKAKIGCSIFIDEGRYFRKKKPPLTSQWEDWGKIAVLISWSGNGY